jgi:hypothetical protein
VRIGHDFAMLAAAVNLQRSPRATPQGARRHRHEGGPAVMAAPRRRAVPVRSPAVSGPREAAWRAARPLHRRFSSTAPAPWRFTPAS